MSEPYALDRDGLIMGRRFHSLSGFILAGGESRRMGRDKARLVLGNATLLERQIRLLRSVCRSVSVLGRPKDFPGLEVPVLADLEPGRGPLGGLATGLSATRTEYNLFLSCDLPRMERRFLHWLAEQALESQAEALVPQTPGRRISIPLCGVRAARACSPPHHAGRRAGGRAGGRAEQSSRFLSQSALAHDSLGRNRPRGLFTPNL